MKTKNIQFEYYDPKQCKFSQPLMRMMNKTQDIVPHNIINSTWYHLSLEVTTSKIMPLVGGLSHVQRTLTRWASMICPSLEDFVTYNGLQLAGLTWFAPHRRTLSRTTDFNPLGQHDLPLIGGLCHVQRTSTRWANMICPSSEDFVTYNGLRLAGSQWSAPHRRTLSCTTDFDPLGLNDHTTRYSINKKTNDTSRVAPRMTQNEYPKTNYY